VRVRNSGSQEELEVGVPWDALVTETESAGLVNLLEQNGFKGRVELLTDVLNKEPLTELDSQLQVSKQGGVTHLAGIKTTASLFLVSGQVLDELVGLTLGVNHEWPSARLKHDNRIFD